MKIYTKTGDDGTTGLFGGGRVPKNHLRVEAYGSVDELNCHLGMVRSANQDVEIDRLLARVQSTLFDLGADLATPHEARAEAKIRRLGPEDSSWLEKEIDRFDREIPQLRYFILPGGTARAAMVHVARSICRRAERAVVALASVEQVSPDDLVFLNRLSDFLFTLGRVLNHRAGVIEEPWKP